MTPFFADTFFFLALLNRNDVAHGRSVSAREGGRRIVTTDFVLLEPADHLCDRKNRTVYIQFYEFLTRDRVTEVVDLSNALLNRGRQLYADRPDKDWSLTDCTSFVVMTDRGLTDALTGDHHFEQAGFTAMLK